MAEHIKPATIVLHVASLFESLSIPYFVSGGLASIVYGMVRTTQDVDFVTELKPYHAIQLAQLLGEPYYVDPDVISEAIKHRSSFNVIHYESSFNVDVHLSPGRPFDQSRFQRRVARQISRDTEKTAFVATPEDVLLAKLDWFRASGERSEHQWRDVLGIIKAQTDRLDLEYVRLWGQTLAVAHLVERALIAAHE